MSLKLGTISSYIKRQILLFLSTMYSLFVEPRGFMTSVVSLCQYIILWYIDNGPVVVSISSFLAILITCLARSPEKRTSEFVWTTFINQSGWSSNGVAFLTGLINPNYIYAGIDGAIHLAEECSNASTAVPFALTSTLTIGFVTAFTFVIAMLYTMTDMDAVINTPTG